MRARVLEAQDPQAIQAAAACLRAGGLVAFPTETVYGLGANALDARAVARIFEVKRRPSFDPLIVHLADASELGKVALSVPPEATSLGARFWPGPLTLVLAKQPAVPDIVSAGLASVGVRVPAHAAARALLRAASTPVAAPSANLFGYVSPTTAAHVGEQFGAEIDLILDGGPCRVGLESTILSLVDARPRLLRPGGLPKEALEAALGHAIEVAPSSDRPQAPGQLSRHYATRTPLVIAESEEALAGGHSGAQLGLLARSGAGARPGYAAVEVLSPSGDEREAAANLFAALRRLDALGLDRLVAEPWPESGLGRAILDRLRRCAAR